MSPANRPWEGPAEHAMQMRYSFCNARTMGTQ
jgi:hypothetical protein